jgi:hypothetical protein
VSASARHLMWNLLAHEWAPWGGLPRPHHGEGLLCPHHGEVSLIPIMGRAPSSPPRAGLPHPHHGQGSLVPIMGRSPLSSRSPAADEPFAAQPFSLLGQVPHYTSFL